MEKDRFCTLSLDAQIDLNPVDSKDGGSGIRLAEGEVCHPRWTDPERIEEKFFRTMAETVPSMICVRGVDMRRIYVNRQWLEFTGRTMEQELATAYAQDMHPDEVQQCVDTYREALCIHQSIQIQYRLRRADGQYRWLLERGVPWYTQEDVFAGYMCSSVDITDLRRKQEALQAEHDDLERLVQERTNALSVANGRLQEDLAVQKLNELQFKELKFKQQKAQLRKLASEVMLAQERERRRIALVLHDDIGQVLALARLKTGELLESLSAASNLGLLESIRDLLDQAAQATRSATFELSSPILHELGLEAALQRLTEDFEKRHGIRFDFRPGRLATALDDRTQVIVYRAVRELFFNIVKHAQARYVTLSVRKAWHHLQISVEDDGVGTDTTRIGQGFGPSGGFGLFSISEQIKGIGGRLEIVSSLGVGTQVDIAVPLG